jgi:hypothetical protein
MVRVGLFDGIDEPVANQGVQMIILFPSCDGRTEHAHVHHQRLLNEFLVEVGADYPRPFNPDMLHMSKEHFIVMADVLEHVAWDVVDWVFKVLFRVIYLDNLLVDVDGFLD